MTDYYTEASFLLDLKTEENMNRAWAILEEIGTFSEHSGDEKFKWSSDHMADLAVGLDLETHEHLYVDIEPHGSTKLWLHHDENIEIGQAASLIQYLMIQLDLDPMGFEWSNNCSKARLDSFSGGACFITKENVEFMNTWNWIDEQAKALAS